jgi:hypothetical protein
MRTPMVDDVKHKWVHLDRIVVKVLLELQPGEYEKYVMDDGTMVMEMNAISYGLAEAAHYWYKHMKGLLKKTIIKAVLKTR